MNPDNQSEFSRKVGEKETRKLKARHGKKRGIWFGFSMFGLVGWSVMVPTLLGALLGNWIDRTYPGKHSWTLALLVVGLVFGVINAWHWVEKESREMEAENGPPEENEKGLLN